MGFTNSATVGKLSRYVADYDESDQRQISQNKNFKLKDLRSIFLIF